MSTAYPDKKTPLKEHFTPLSPVPENWDWRTDPNCMPLSTAAKKLGLTREGLRAYLRYQQNRHFFFRKDGSRVVVYFPDIQAIRRAAGLNYEDRDSRRPQPIFAVPQPAPSKEQPLSFQESLDAAKEWYARPDGQEVAGAILEYARRRFGQRRAFS